MLLGRAHNVDSMTNICLLQLLWDFWVFLQSIQDIMQHLMMHGSIYTVKVGFSGEKAARLCGSIECSGSFCLFCLPAPPVPPSLTVDVLKGRNMHLLGEVNRCLFLRCCVVYSAFHHLLCLQSAVCLLCDPVMMSWNPCLHSSQNGLIHLFKNCFKRYHFQFCDSFACFCSFPALYFYSGTPLG